jgi:hypothetical protein
MLTQPQVHTWTLRDVQKFCLDCLPCRGCDLQITAVAVSVLEPPVLRTGSYCFYLRSCCTEARGVPSPEQKADLLCCLGVWEALFLPRAVSSWLAISPSSLAAIWIPSGSGSVSGPWGPTIVLGCRGDVPFFLAVCEDLPLLGVLWGTWTETQDTKAFQEAIFISMSVAAQWIHIQRLSPENKGVSP